MNTPIEESPKLFISYSWTSQQHQDWVLELANALVENGVDVILDKWELREGNDAYAFMEKSVTDPTIRKVLLVCDKTYAEKANSRTGGVGTESQIISPEVYAQGNQSKFVAIVTEYDELGRPCVPAYYQSKIYIDLSSEEVYAKNFEQLIRWIFDQPIYVKPPIGKPPEYLQNSDSTTLSTSSRSRRAIELIKSGQIGWSGALTEYLSTFSVNLERFRLPQRFSDDQLITNLESFLPWRNEMISVLSALATYRDDEQVAKIIHKFFESLLPYLDRPETVQSWSDGDFDNFRFFVRELFLYSTALLLEHERFSILARILRTPFYRQNPDLRVGDTTSFAEMSQHLPAFERRNHNLHLNRLSLAADLIKERSQSSGVSFRALSQADFVLFLRCSVDALLQQRAIVFERWIPITLVYSIRESRTFEIFARSKSKEYFSEFSQVLGISSKSELTPLLTAIHENKIYLPTWDHMRPNILQMLGGDSLATLP